MDINESDLKFDKLDGQEHKDLIENTDENLIQYALELAKSKQS